MADSELQIPEDEVDYGDEDEQGTGIGGIYKQSRGTLGGDERNDSVNAQSGRARRPKQDGASGQKGFCGSGQDKCAIF